MKKGKRETKKFKLSQYDRVQGLIRNNLFLRDLKKTIYPFPNKPNTKGFSIQQERDFYNKYKITLPPSYSYQSFNQCLKLIRQNVADIGFEDDFTVRTIPVKDAKLIAVGEPEKLHKERIKEHPHMRQRTFEYNKHPFIRDGKYISLEIDLTKDINVIVNKVKDMVSFFNRRVKKSKLRATAPRSLPVDIWEVHDLHKMKSLNFSEIAQFLSDIKDAPQHNPKLLACYKAVKYAYKKAEQIITIVTK